MVEAVKIKTMILMTTMMITVMKAVMMMMMPGGKTAASKLLSSRKMIVTSRDTNALPYNVQRTWRNSVCKCKIIQCIV